MMHSGAEKWNMFLFSHYGLVEIPTLPCCGPLVLEYIFFLQVCNDCIIRWFSRKERKMSNAIVFAFSALLTATFVSSSWIAWDFLIVMATLKYFNLSVQILKCRWHATGLLRCLEKLVAYPCTLDRFILWIISNCAVSLSSTEHFCIFSSLFRFSGPQLDYLV